MSHKHATHTKQIKSKDAPHRKLGGVVAAAATHTARVTARRHRSSASQKVMRAAKKVAQAAEEEGALSTKESADVTAAKAAARAAHTDGLATSTHRQKEHSLA